MNLPGFGWQQQLALHNAHVQVIGAGGLGCPVLQTLAATGVGHLTVVDDDTVSITNIHRQILFGAGDVGRPKIEVVSERLRQLQPGIELSLVNARFNASNARELLDGVDVLVDGSDTFTTKFLAADAAEMTGVPLVWGSVLRYRGDVAVWWSGPGAPADGVGMRDLYPAQPDPDSVPDCATAGVLGVTTSVVGSLMATEAVKFLAGIGDRDIGTLRIYDALTASIRHFHVHRDPHRELVTDFGDYMDRADSCTPPSPLVAKLAQGRAFGLDVREPHEKAVSDLRGGTHHLPTSQWENNPDLALKLLDSLPEGSDVVVYCAAGARSARFVECFAEAAAARSITLESLPGGTNRYGLESVG